MALSQHLPQSLNDALLAAVDESVIFLDSHYTVKSCSQGTHAWLNIDALVGLNLQALFDEEVQPAFAKLWFKANAGKAAHVETLIKPESNEIFGAVGLLEATWFRIRIVPCKEGAVVTLKDISESKRLARGGAQRDIVTGAYNQRTFMPVVNQAMSQAKRYDWVCSVMVIDIDHFSEINNTHGWDIGDMLLQSLVSTVDKMKRTADFLARLSDDEFAVFLPETNAEQAIGAANRVLGMIRDTAVDIGDETLGFTVSVGTATLSDEDDGANSVIVRARHNQKLATKAGGNCVVGE